MKKTILSLIILSTFCFGTTAQNVNIPDANFKAFLVGYTFINTNSDSEIQVSEASAFNGEMYCYNLGITDFTGIEAFTGMTDFGCNSNLITTLDLSQNTALKNLYCSSNNLTSLILNQCTALEVLHCDNNNLTTLDVSQNTALTFLNCSNNNLDDLDVSQNTALKTLNSKENNITTIDLNQNAALEILNISYNDLTSLSVNQNTALTDLKCYFSNLSTLDVSQNTALKKLECNHNSITSLDVSQNTALTNLLCMVNNLSTIDVSQNTALTDFACNNNNIGGSLDVSQCTALTTLYCGNNDLTGLKLKNLSSSTMVTVSTNGNPSLTCIEVDDVAATQANVTNLNIDNSTNLSLDCSVSVSSITIQGQAGASTISTSGGTLQMEASVLPANADDATYTWDIINGTGSATITPNGLVTAITDGTVTVTATANDGSGIMGSEMITISNQIVLVTSITVQGQAGASTIMTLGGVLQMEASILPANATDNTYTWSITNGTGSATINATGLLTAMTDGIVTVSATANDGSGLGGSTVITISNQSSSSIEQSIIYDLSIYPNPATSQIVVSANSKIEVIKIIDMMGRRVETMVLPNATIDISKLSKGIYFLEIQIGNALINKKIIKE